MCQLFYRLYMIVPVNIQNQIHVLANTRSQVKRTVYTVLGSVAKYKVQAELDRFKLKSFQQRNVECSAMAGGERSKAIIAHEAITVNVFFSLTSCFRNRVLNDTSCPVLSWIKRTVHSTALAMIFHTGLRCGTD